MPLWGEKLIYNTVLFHVIQIHVLPNIMVMGDFFFFFCKFTIFIITNMIKFIFHL